MLDLGKEHTGQNVTQMVRHSFSIQEKEAQPLPYALPTLVRFRLRSKKHVRNECYGDSLSQSKCVKSRKNVFLKRCPEMIDGRTDRRIDGQMDRQTSLID